MKKGIYIFIFFIFCLSTKAQKYGVSIGYAYSYGKAEHPIEMRDFYNYKFSNVKFKYNILPNAFVRPYLRVYKKINVFVGIDITQYEINFNQNTGATNLWSKRVKQMDLHFPIGLKINLLDENKKFGHSIYGGIFFINHIKGTQWLRLNGGSEIGDSKGFGVKPKILIFNNQKTNFIIGYEFNYKLKKWFPLALTFI
ncbi:MAG: hypothetical protein IPG89_16660 [Bacteroidetes bacterium]|nr:hypothetical protein [Bacteroidota bacterium]